MEQMILETRILALDSGSIADPTKLVGKAVVYNSRSTLPITNEKYGTFWEVIEPGSFKNISRDVPLIRNHDMTDDKACIARTGTGSLVFTDSADSLSFVAKIPAVLNDEQKAIVQQVVNGNLNGVSPQFIVTKDRIEGTGANKTRYIMEADLLEISLVLFPTYTETTVEARSIPEVLKEAQPTEEAKQETQKEERSIEASAQTISAAEVNKVSQTDNTNNQTHNNMADTNTTNSEPAVAEARSMIDELKKVIAEARSVVPVEVKTATETETTNEAETRFIKVLAGESRDLNVGSGFAVPTSITTDTQLKPQVGFRSAFAVKPILGKDNIDVFAATTAAVGDADLNFAEIGTGSLVLSPVEVKAGAKMKYKFNAAAVDASKQEFANTILTAVYDKQDAQIWSQITTRAAGDGAVQTGSLTVNTGSVFFAGLNAALASLNGNASNDAVLVVTKKTFGDIAALTNVSGVPYVTNNAGKSYINTAYGQIEVVKIGSVATDSVKAVLTARSNVAIAEFANGGMLYNQDRIPGSASTAHTVISWIDAALVRKDFAVILS